MSRGQCRPCAKNSECAKDLVCHQSMCLNASSKDVSLNRCTGKAKSCDQCSSDDECASRSCEGGKCVPCSEECGGCWGSGDCDKGLSCIQGACLRKADLHESEKNCFLSLGECDHCAYDYECADENLSCVYGRCIIAKGNGVAASVERCFGNGANGNVKESSGGIVCKVKRAFPDE